MSGVVGRSHCISTIGGTGLVSLELRGGPGQTVSESEGSCLRLRHWHGLYNVLLVLAAVYDDQHFHVIVQGSYRNVYILL